LAAPRLSRWPWSLAASHSICAAVLLQSTPHPSPRPEDRELVVTKTPPSEPLAPLALRRGGKRTARSKRGNARNETEMTVGRCKTHFSSAQGGPSRRGPPGQADAGVVGSHRNRRASKTRPTLRRRGTRRASRRPRPATTPRSHVIESTIDAAAISIIARTGDSLRSSVAGGTIRSTRFDRGTDSPSSSSAASTAARTGGRLVRLETITAAPGSLLQAPFDVAPVGAWLVPGSGESSPPREPERDFISDRDGSA